MIPILSGNVASALGGGYEVANSCRFNDGDSPDMLKNLSSGSRTKWTFSTWFKRSALSSTQYLFRCIEDGNAGNYTYLQFNSSDQLRFLDYSSSNNADLKTNRLFRDVSAWYHVCLIIDTTDGTAGDRQKLYINGVRETSFASSANYSSSFDTNMNVADYKFNIAYDGDNSGSYFDGYLAETVFLDGTDEAIGSFGEFDEDSPTIWKPKDVSGLTFGTNGFYLDYEDSSNLGNDANGGTDFTETNLAAADQATDTPTNNFCTMNPLDNYYPASTFSEGNCKVVQGGSAFAWNLSTIAVTAGKWYAEAKLTTSGSYALVGITDTPPTSKTTKILGSRAYDYSVYQYNGDLYNNAGDNPANDDANYAASYASGDIIGIALDITNSKIYFSKNGAWSDGSGSWDSSTFNASVGAVTITAPASTNNGHYFFGSGDYESGSQPTWEWNFGGCPPNTISSGNADDNGYGNFEYAPPSGFLALCTKNLGSDGG